MQSSTPVPEPSPCWASPAELLLQSLVDSAPVLSLVDEGCTPSDLRLSLGLRLRLVLVLRLGLRQLHFVIVTVFIVDVALTCISGIANAVLYPRSHCHTIAHAWGQPC